MNQRPIVSVIVPAFNVEPVLSETLASAQNQTCRELEVIVVDDGSTDSSLAIAQRFAASDPRFKALSQSNAGSAAARNTGLRAACGEWIAFLDADDVWLPGKIETQLQLAASDPKANFLFTNYWNWDGQRDLSVYYRDRRKFPEGNVWRELIYWGLFRTSTVMVRRQTLDVVGFLDPELRNVHDWDLWLRIAEAGFWARGVWEPQARYRVWASNVSANRINIARYVVRTLEKAIARPQPAARLRDYRRALSIARAQLELMQAQSLVASSPESVPAAVLRGWRCDPRNVKWLLRYIGLVWPVALGGKWTSAAVRGTLQRWRMGQRLDAGKSQSPQ